MKTSTYFKGMGVAMALAASSASATVMDFTGMVSFTNYTQNSMDMTSTSVWNWPGANMAHMDGGIASFALTSGGVFDLTGVDMVAGGGSGPARFVAVNNNVVLGAVDVAGNAGTFSFSALFSGIDEFRVSVPSSHFTFDNVVFNASSVPVPATLALLGLGISGLAFRRKKSLAAG